MAYEWCTVNKERDGERERASVVPTGGVHLANNMLADSKDEKKAQLPCKTPPQTPRNQETEAGS